MSTCSTAPTVRGLKPRCSLIPRVCTCGAKVSEGTTSAGLPLHRFVSVELFVPQLLLLLMQVFNTPNVRQYMSESQTWNHHMTSYENDDSNKRVLSFRLKLATLSDCLISISILFQTLGAATEKALDAIFVRHLGMLSNCF